MSIVINPDIWWSGKQPPPHEPTEPPLMNTSERVTKTMGITLATLATKEDLARVEAGLRQELLTQTWRFVTWVTGFFIIAGIALVSATYFLLKHG